MDNYHPHHRRYFTGRTCLLHPDELTLHAAELALHRAEQALREGRLISPMEAMAAAMGEARDKETLFSIARATAWETGGDQDEILCRLGERYLDFT
jgi:hypothetical protein